MAPQCRCHPPPPVGGVLHSRGTVEVGTGTEVLRATAAPLTPQVWLSRDSG